jgi:ribosomal protein S18 acetylase RimI-like enzyme
VCALHDRARRDELEGSCDARAFVPLEDEEEDRESFQRSEKFVACVGEQVLGFVGLDRTYISWLYVDPVYYGRGIGGQMLRLGVERIGPQAWTVILARNTRARRLYQSRGFRVVRTFEGTHAGYPCTCLKLSLSSSMPLTAEDQGQGTE